eukprot:CAMPEP_0116854066 /NCGR_PEP_ID=MMETSP0418-20121206/18352_1 /TAXON_ID=1158023 /ORGANISM="Astrosyne radiata, Strain 13vi08-1A" /LENGTH=89 /DNA_ID=CAMNT_0004486719 /DNA_START=75 /DNA_END=344 /DNA_ORIENTATION=-
MVKKNTVRFAQDPIITTFEAESYSKSRRRELFYTRREIQAFRLREEERQARKQQRVKNGCYYHKDAAESPSSISQKSAYTRPTGIAPAA